MPDVPEDCESPTSEARIMTTLMQKIERWLWAARGHPIPEVEPVKLRAVLENKGERRVFIETGTGLGSMLDAVKEEFPIIVSIELDSYLYDVANSYFGGRDDCTVLIINGDSVGTLPKILQELTRPAVFWLDAHYSGGITTYMGNPTPVREELKAILAHPLCNQHVILIDDASSFGVCEWYPTLDEVRQMAERNWMAMEVRDDIIRIKAVE